MLLSKCPCKNDYSLLLKSQYKALHLKDYSYEKSLKDAIDNGVDEKTLAETHPTSDEQIVKYYAEHGNIKIVRETFFNVEELLITGEPFWEFSVNVLLDILPIKKISFMSRRYDYHHEVLAKMKKIQNVTISGVELTINDLCQIAFKLDIENPVLISFKPKTRNQNEIGKAEVIKMFLEMIRYRRSDYFSIRLTMVNKFLDSPTIIDQLNRSMNEHNIFFETSQTVFELEIYWTSQQFEEEKVPEADWNFLL